MTFKAGDKVRFSSDWLKSTGQVTGEVPFMRGVVTAVKDLSEDRQIVTVRWGSVEDDEPYTSRVLSSNLEVCR